MPLCGVVAAHVVLARPRRLARGGQAVRPVPRVRPAHAPVRRRRRGGQRSGRAASHGARGE